MRPVYRSFYGKLSLIFLALIVAIGAIVIAIAFNASGHLFDEVEQVLNREYAASIAVELQPLVSGGFSEAGIREAIHYMMVLNPMVEIYLLDEEGKVMAYFTHPSESLSRTKVELGPVRTFISGEGQSPVLGDDPRSPSRRKPFSAATLRMGEESGYVYVILRGESFYESLGMLRSNYFLRTGLMTFLLALFAASIAGLSLFFLLTRRIRLLSTAVRAFEQGELDRRLLAVGSDEVGALGKAFNDMAESIQTGVEKLQESERQRSELIANISHDLRSPLTSIRGNLETLLLKEADPSGPEGKEFLEAALRNVAGFQDLVEDLFELARLETGQISLRKETMPLSELVQDVVIKLQPAAQANGTEIRFDPSEDRAPVSVDPRLIDRLVTNIVENAVAHTPEGGSINVHVRPDKNDVVLVVSDTGEGIAQSDLPNVFERFYRGDKSRDRSVPGTGLGLAIAKEIAELHSGGISAANGTYGGAEITVRFPGI